MPPAAETELSRPIATPSAAVTELRRPIATAPVAAPDVAAPFPVSLAAISKHLAVLAGAGLIRQERRGRIIWCKLDPDGLRRASVWMQGFGQFDPVDLDALDRFLEAELATDLPD